MKTLLTFTKLPRLIAAPIFGALALSCGSLAIAAADDRDMPQIAVKFADLTLSNPQDANKLYSRIAEAAHEVCKAYDVNSGDIISRAPLNTCVHKAIAGAVAKADRAELLAVYKEKNHQPLPIIVAATR